MNSDRESPDADQAPAHSTPQNQILTNNAPDASDVPSSADPTGTRILYVVVAMIVFMFLLSVGFLIIVIRHRL